MHGEVIDARFILSQKSSRKLIFHQKQSLYEKSYFYFSFKQFWAIESSKSIIEEIEKINCKANAKAILRFDFSTIYTKLSHFDLVC